MTEVINYYEKIPKKYLTTYHNPHYSEHGIKIPFRMLIIGASGSGKTNVARNIISKMKDTFGNIKIVCKNADEPLYKWLQSVCDQIIIKEGLSYTPPLDKFDKEKIDLENHQKSRDKSYYSEQAVNVPYTITYLIDTVFNYNNTLSLVFKVVEENAIPGLEDFYYDIYTFKFDNEKAILINKLYYLNKDKENMFKQIEHVLSKCKIFNTVNLNNLIIQIDKNKYIILL
jgi:ABC-type oligopeptide transport system ATPase subunit